MNEKTLIIMSLSFLLIGAVILLNAFKSITGYAVFENVSTYSSTLMGIWFLAASLLTYLYTAAAKQQGKM